MSLLTKDEALMLKKELQHELLGSIVRTLETRIKDRIGPTNMDAIQRAFAELHERTEFDDYLYLEINATGLHVLDRKVEFHL